MIVVLGHNGAMTSVPDSSAPIVPDTAASDPRSDDDAGQSSAARLIYGAMGLGGSWTTENLTDEDLRTGFQALDTALQVGIRDIDLADIYTLGKSETTVGQWLAADPARRSQVTLQTKAGIRLPGITTRPEAPVHYRLDAATLRAGLEGSLDRLGVSSVDRFLIHRWDPLADPAEVAATLDALVDDGLTAGLGISNVSWHRTALLQRHLHHPLQAVQVQLSLGHRDFVERQILWDHPDATGVDFSEELLDECAAAGIELQAWGSLDQGRYTRPVTPKSGQAAPGGADTDPAAPDGAGPGDAGTDGTGPDGAAAGLVREIATELSTSPEAVVLAWLMRLPQRIRPVIGTTNPARIQACAQAETVVGKITHEHWYALLNAARGSNIP